MKNILTAITVIAILSNLNLLANSWHNKDLQYFKIITTQNKIAKLELNKLLEIAPELEGKNSNDLHLIFQGEKYPFFYNSEIIQKNTELYFLGKHNLGDTSYFDDYSFEAVFYLYFDENETSEKVKIFNEPTSTTSEINSVFIDYHLEKDLEYYLGYNVLNYDTDRFEGWYWKIIRDYPSNNPLPIHLHSAQFIENTVFYPDENSEEDFEFTVRFTTTVSNQEKQNINRKIYTVINADTVNRTYFDTLADNFISTVKISTQKLFAGTNSFQMFNMTADNVDSRIGIDWFKIRGWTKPFAFNSNSVFDVKNISANSAIKISGFADSNIIIYDTVSKSLIEKKGIPTVTVSANAKIFLASENTDEENTVSFSSLRINDEIYTSEVEGFHIAILRNGATVAEFHSFGEFNNSVNQLLQNINNSSFVTVTYNGKNEFPTNVRNFLIENGCSQINDFTVGTVYTCAFKVGENKAVERYSKNYLSKLDTTFFDAERRNFTLEFNLEGSFENPISYSFNISDATAIQNVEIKKAKKTDYRNTENSAEMIIIYHKKFEENARKYAEYRESTGHKIFLADVEEVYKEFGFGRKTPRSIKNFLIYSYDYWQKPAPRYVLFIGDASNDPRMCLASSVSIDFVPTYGNPASDYWFGLFDKNNSERKAEMIVGRIPASTNEHIENYLEKVKSYEATVDAKWHKNFLFLNGGFTQQEKNSIRRDSRVLGSYFATTPFCADTVMINKADDDLATVSTANRTEIISAVNNGAMMTVFNGHGSTGSFEMWGWQVDNLNNKDRFGILATMSCNTGDFAAPTSQLIVNEDYILRFKDRGFIAALGATTTSTIGSNVEIMYNLITEMLPEYHYQIKPNQRRIGDLLESAKRKINYFSGGDYANVMRFCFGILGDPMIEIKIDTVPDIFVNANEISVRGENNSVLIQENDKKVFINFPIHNSGIAVEESFTVKLIHSFADEEPKEYFYPLHQFCRSKNLHFEVPIYGKSGEHSLTVIADFENKIFENNKENNIATVNFYVNKFGLYAVEPLQYWNMKHDNLLFRVINPLKNTSDFEYYFSIEQIIDDEILLIKNSNFAEITVFENYIDWIPATVIENNKDNYLFSAWQKDLNTEIISDKLTIPFNTNNFSAGAEPTAELAIRSATNFVDKDVLRGDTVRLNLEFENISLRENSLPAKILLEIFSLNLETPLIFEIPSVPKNSIMNLQFEFASDFLENNNTVSITLDYENLNNELYFFNNFTTRNLTIFEDTVSPTLEIFFDGIRIRDSGYISRKPFIEIKLLDNSKLPVTVVEPITVRMNGVSLTVNNTDSFELETFEKGSEIKAILKIIPEEIKDEVNYFRFSGVDASGNPVVENYFLFIPLHSFIWALSTYPNPVLRAGNLNIEYELVSPLTSHDVEIEIFNAIGLHIKTLHFSANKLQNTISWDMCDHSGSLINPGTYYYRLNIISEIWTTPHYGKFIFAK